jgi:hypothetical protein
VERIVEHPSRLHVRPAAWRDSVPLPFSGRPISMSLLPLRPAIRCLPYVRGPKLIRWGRKAVKLARRHRSSLDETTLVSPEVRTIARSDREHRGPSPRQLRGQASRQRAEELVVDTGVGVLGQDLGRRLAGRVSKATLLERASLPERNALRSRRQRLMMLG